MKLYYGTLSGHSHRARLFQSLLGIDYESIALNLRGGAHLTPEFLGLNRFGEVPVLDDDGVVIADSNAILVYLAKKFGNPHWLPADPVAAANVQRWLSVAAANVQRWLSVAAGKLAYGPCAAAKVRAWLHRVEALPGLFPFQKTKAGLQA